MQEKIEKYVLRTGAAISIVVGLLELIGAFHNSPKIHEWIEDHAPVLCVVFFGAILGALVQLAEHVHGLKRRADEQSLVRLKRLNSELDPDLSRVVGPEFQRLVEQIASALELRTLRLANGENFRSLYKRTLESYSGARFLATSIPSTRFFWKNETIEKSIRSFIEGGGEMERIFFIDGSISDLGEEEKRILRIQVALGVEVFVTVRDLVPEELRRFIMVEEQGRIGWEPSRDPTGEITAINISSHRDTTARFVEIFRKIKTLDCTQPYVDDTGAPDLNSPYLSNPKATLEAINVEQFKQFEHDGWEQSVDAYDTLFGPLTTQVIEPMLAGLHPRKLDTLLDVATGPGYLAVAAERMGCVATGIDISESMVGRAKRKHPSSRVDFRVGDAEAMVGLDNFDVVAMNFGILHLAQPEIAAKEAYRLLKVGGRFGFSVWAPPDQSIGFSIVLRAIETYGSPAVRLPAGPPFFQYGHRDQGIGLLTSSGFSSPKAQLLSLQWRLPKADSLFEAFYHGTARTGGNLRAQPAENRERIKQAVGEEVMAHRKGAEFVVPMAAWVYIGERFEAKVPPSRAP